MLEAETTTRIRQQDPALDPSDVLRVQVELQLERRTQPVATAASSTFQQPPDLSAWLQTTQWAQYLQGHSLSAAAELAVLPRDSRPEPDLVLLLESLDRLDEQARDSVVQGKINIFDQQRINSFLRSGTGKSRVLDRPMGYKLKEATYRGYKKVWKQLCASSTESCT
jgi:hypothetical protein